MIDWFTVVAQLINFLILIGLLKYFLYGRIMEAIENRESEINKLHDEAVQHVEKAREELERAKNKNRELDHQREQLVSAVKNDVEEFRKQQMEKVREEIEGVQVRWSDSIHEQQEVFLSELKQRATDSVCAIARQALADLADASLESRIVSRFLDKVRNLGDGERDSLVATLASANQEAVIQTTYDLSKDLKSALVDELESLLKVSLDARFETVGDLQCGIALQTNSHKLAWNMRDYLTTLEDEMRTLFEEESSAHRHSGNMAEA